MSRWIQSLLTINNHSVSRSLKLASIGFRKYSSTNTDHNVFDVVIVGGGIAGLALACALGKVASSTSLGRIALINEFKIPPLEKNQPFTNRVYSITPQSATILRDIGAWALLEPSRIKHYTSMNVWDAVGNGVIQFDSSKSAVSSNASNIPTAYVIENLNLQHALAKFLNGMESDGIQVFSPASVTSIVRSDDDPDGWPQIHIKSGPTLKTRLLIGADGATSSVREFAKIGTAAIDYNQRGIVATLEVDTSVSSTGPENTCAWQRFLPSGPIALLPLGDYHCSLVWSVDTDLAKNISLLSNEHFMTLLNAALLNPYQDIEFLCSQIDKDGHPSVDFGDEAEWGRQRVLSHDKDTNTPIPPLVVAIQDGSRAEFPLRLSHASGYVGSRVALVGDAAHVVHPLAGQGLNLGLSDVSALASVIEAGLQSGQDIGSVIILEDYAKARYAQNVFMSIALHGIQKLFGTDLKVVSWLRSFGLNSVNRVAPIKNLFMKLAGA